MKYKKIYFDLDGTIIDSSNGVVNSALYALEKYDMDNYSIEEIKTTLIGPPLYLGLKNLTDENDEKIDLLAKAFREEYSKQGVFQNLLFSGIKELLETLHKTECIMYILTSKPQKFAEQILKQHNIKHFFDKVDGAGEKDKNSSKIDKLGILAKEEESVSIMIGDRIEDILAGQKNCIDTIAVTYGFDNLNLLKQQNPTYIVHKASDILEIIK